MRRIKNIIFVGLLAAAGFSAQAQRTQVYKEPDAAFREAEELFAKEKYGAAQELFARVAKKISEKESLQRVDAEYFAAVCDMRLFHKNADQKMIDFLDNHPTSNRRNDAVFELANYYYGVKKYRDAHQTFAEIDPKDVPENHKDEYNFKRGYSLFSDGNSDAAKTYFYDVKQGSSKYVPLATYYYAYILYTEKKYETAREDFETLREDENFGKIVPFYILQIYHKQEKYDKVIAEGPAMTENASARRAAEISRLIGEAYYHTNHFDSALPYFRTYFAQSATSPNRDENYMLGYTYYHMKIYDTAAVFFQKVATAEQKDLLEQNALYHLADCYMHLDLLRFAHAAFYDASRIEMDPLIEEDAYYNYVKLTYELSPATYGDAINEFEKYLEKYPDSKHKQEILRYQVEMYLTTRNYKAALESIEKIKQKNVRLTEAYQRIAFNRGVELFNERKYSDALTLFDKSLEHTFDDRVEAQARFWKAETEYRMDDYKAASQTYESFLNASGASTLPVYNLAHYNLGYAYFKQDKNADARKNFQLFLQKASEEDPALVNDAYLRLGDNAFLLKDYPSALAAYNHAVDMKAYDQDYALFQKGLALGVMSRFDEKITALQKLLKDYPESLFAASAVNELATTYLIVENNPKALEYYQLLSSKYNSSSYGKTAMLKQGLIYYNAGDNDKAIGTFKKIVSDAPNSPEASEALMNLRNIYMDMNRINDFFAYTKNIPSAQVNPEAQDSITFNSADARYNEGDYEGARIGFVNYLENFPQGVFTLQAQYLLADCDYRKGNTNDALIYFDKVINAPLSSYTETSLLNAARITYDNKDYERALNYYKKLEQQAENPANKNIASIGIMRCYKKMDNDEEKLKASQKVLTLSKISEEVKDEANHNIATAATFLNKPAVAQEKYAELRKSKNPEYAAEAAYNQMEQLVIDGKYDEAEKMIFKLISENPSSEYYLAKTYILWADIYMARSNFLQAKQTLQSIIDNYTEDQSLVDFAKAKKEVVIRKEEEAKRADAQRRLKDAGDEDEIPEPTDI